MTKADHITECATALDVDEDRSGSSALLGLEPPAVEKAGENSNSQPDPAFSTCYAPLLGTIF
ncbi:hypothetical protein [Sphingomonas sp. Y38-1Y]|uniref:hypothetical protein n=1 Tax=Sphingomonas sp. Y38-1Y TaxID=3078265 RepID=UPI0028ED7BF0|nr:hypothetical protein [Sphingomonas sp. Y38-1Y]